MKVLKEPALIDWKIEKECSIKSYSNVGCGALLEIETADIYLTSFKDYYRSEDSGERIYYDVPIFAVKCPCCGEEIAIDNKEIPKDVRNSIKNVEQNKKKKMNYMESFKGVI